MATKPDSPLLPSPPVSNPPPPSPVSNQFSTTPISIIDNLSNPLFLHQAENPGAILMSQLLLGAQNYSTWSRSMLMALTIKNKIGFIDGTLPKPSSECPLYFDWLKCNMMVTSWLFISISKDIAGSVMSIDSTTHLWNDLREQFNKPQCTHCGKLGHTIDKCYRLHGFPPGFKFTKGKPISAHLANSDQDILSQPPILDMIQEQCQSLLSSLQKQANISTPSPFVYHTSTHTDNASFSPLVPNFSGAYPLENDWNC